MSYPVFTIVVGIHLREYQEKSTYNYLLNLRR